MLIPQKARRKTVDGHGRPTIALSELRSQLANGSSPGDGHRQRLLDLAQRLARIQALGDEYAGITLSPMAAGVVEQAEAAAV
ncbi:MAG: hypothetical protein FWE88_00815 [Phycisphaerae bacterium]|nr:hypothetical protein [Phycisphaerae bacterium]